MTEAPGWDALDRALGAGGEALRFDVESAEGAPCLASVVARRQGGHWLFATYGLTELFEKSSPDADLSGHGYELVLRLETRGDDPPPAWPAELLRAVAGYVEASGAQLDDGHYIDVGEPLGRGLETRLTALLVVSDPELAAFDGPFGRVRFLALVGVTADELELLLDWSVAGLASELARDNPLLLTKPERASLLETERASEVRAAVAREGSSLERLSAELWVQVDGAGASASLALEPSAVEPLRRLLESRVAHARPVVIDGVDGALELVPGDEPKWEATDEGVRVTLPADVALAWRDELSEQPGNVPRALVQGLWVRIVPTGS